MRMIKIEGMFDRYFLLAVYVVFFLLPWYKLPNGWLQPVDASIAVMLSLLFFNRNYLQVELRALLGTVAPLMVVLGYMIVRYIWMFFHSENEALYLVGANSYYLTLIVMFLVMLSYLHISRPSQAFCDIILNCLLMSTALPLCTLLIFGPHYQLTAMQLKEPSIVRPVLTFNNPNQMGFFALVNLSVFFYLGLWMREYSIEIKKTLSLLIININLLFLLLSVSRGAVPAIILYAFSYFLIFDFKIIKKYPVIAWVAIGIVCGSSMIGVYIYHYLLLVNKGVISGIQLKVAQDFYLRAIQGIEYNFKDMSSFLFGAGLMSNPLRIDGAEFHNNFTSLFNQAGLIAFFLYFYVLVKIIISLFKKGVLYVLPFACYLFYSDMHYAFRSRINWLFLAFILFIHAAYKSQTDAPDGCQVRS